MNKSFHISIYTSFLIIITFFVVKVMLLSGFINSSVYTDWYEFISLLLFLPPFCIILKENHIFFFLLQKKCLICEKQKKLDD